MTVFLIDDVQDDREIFLLALKTLDSSIKSEVAESGVKALDRINLDASFVPDYIFLDLNMPYMSGRECLVKLKEIKRLRKVPVILYSTIQDFEELASLGANGFITKKDSIEALVKELSGIITVSDDADADVRP